MGALLSVKLRNIMTGFEQSDLSNEREKSDESKTVFITASGSTVSSENRITVLQRSSKCNYPLSQTSDNDDNDTHSSQAIESISNSVNYLEIVKQRLNKLQLYWMVSTDNSKASIRQANENFMTAETVLAKYGEQLTQYELMEIIQYAEVYCFGKNAIKRYNADMEMNSWNDDLFNFYKCIPHDHIAYRYEILHSLGRGGFGEVVKAYDHKYKEFVAIKIVKNRPKSMFLALKEINILQYLHESNLNDDKSIVTIKNAFLFRKHICIVFELLSCSLFDLMKKNGCRGFSIELTKNFVRNLLHTLKFLSSHKIVHGDIKPENIIKCLGSAEIKLADFGLSNFVRRKKKLTKPIQTRWYRAPEVLLGGPYSEPVDMWSLGCVIAELLTGQPLLPGEDECDQIALIIELIGVPPSYIIRRSRHKDKYFKFNGTPLYMEFISPNVAGVSPNGEPRGYPGTKSLSLSVGYDDSDLIDLLEKCLTWDPSRRIFPQAALRHPWLKKIIPAPPSEVLTMAPLRLCQYFKLSIKKFLYKVAFPSPYLSSLKTHRRRNNSSPIPVTKKVVRRQTLEPDENKHYVYKSVLSTF